VCVWLVCSIQGRVRLPTAVGVVDGGTQMVIRRCVGQTCVVRFVSS